MMELTGERMLPSLSEANTFWEHIYRYRFAAKFVRHKRVLDIACGEGYGARALTEIGATKVVAADIAPAACTLAQKHNVQVACVNAEKIPFPMHSFDAVVSFETIEHLDNPQSFLDECVRVLVPGGTLILSTPNRNVYSERGKHNPFHRHEFDMAELLELFKCRFGKVRLYSQRPRDVAWWSPRSLAADRTPWVNVRGFWRLRHLLRKHTCSHLWSDLNGSARDSVVQLIAAGDAPFSYLANSFAVRKWSDYHQEQPYYFIVVATL
jgi:SAM-dependent methyltransferase